MKDGRKKKSKISKVKRFIDVKVINMDKQQGSKNHDIITNEANGNRVVIQDGYEGAISEYVYNNLKDAQATDHIFLRDASEQIIGKETKLRPRVEVIAKGDFYTVKKGKRVFDTPEDLKVPDTVIKQPESNKVLPSDPEIPGVDPVGATA